MTCSNENVFQPKETKSGNIAAATLTIKLYSQSPVVVIVFQSDDKINLRQSTFHPGKSIEMCLSAFLVFLIRPPTIIRIIDFDGYFKGVGTIRNSTLVILSRYLGFKDWEDFLAHLNQDNGSDPVLSTQIKTNDLSIGDRIMVSWKPNRRCTFRYLGDQQFIVEEAVNSKLKANDSFFCAVFILNAPLYLTNLVQGNNPPVTFVAGKKDGLCEVKKI